MSYQRQKKKFLSVLSSPLRALRSRPPSPNRDNVELVDSVQAGGCSPEGSARLPATTESLADSSRVQVISIDPQIVNVGPDRRLDQRYTANPHGSTAIFSDIEQLNIGVGNFTLNVNNPHHDPLKHVAFQTLPRSRDAAFSASINLDNLSRRRCTDGTRVDIIAQIMAWANETDPAKSPPVYWLSGLAGLGKTTIAYSICELLDKAHLPFASFFCSLQLDSRNSKLLVTTLCRDLAELYNSYAATVLPVLETNSKVVDAGLRIQIDELLAKPWQASICQRQGHGIPIPIVVVDALDECDHGSEFLEQLLRVIHANQLEGIKFLVTSRPDPKIVTICKLFPPNAVCILHEVDTANVQNDIEKYLREALPELKDEPELRLLSQRAGGLFIYATTAVRFISPLHTSHSVSEMRAHLQTMLNPVLLDSHADSDERLLVDELYQRILGVAFRGTGVRATRLRILHTIVCAESRIDISVLADLTNTDQDTVKRVVDSLHAVLFVSPKDGFVYWYHASFPDFIFSRSRARISLSLRKNGRKLEFDAFCDARAHHGVLAQRCLSVMHKSLHFNMCNLPSSYMFDSDVPGLNASIDKTFSLTFRYASRQWARHLVQTLPAENDADDLLCGLKDFLDNKLLFWIEAMNLIGPKSECFSVLKDAESWLEKGKKWPDLLGQLADSMSFSTFFAGSEASKSTPHLYISALSMWNQDSPIWRNWRHRFGLIPSILPTGTITIPLLTINEAESVRCIALSSDGNKIVSGSYKVWDAKSGKLLMELQRVIEPPFSNSAASIVFSPDGNQIVSGSVDKSVRVWNAKTGELLRELQGHTDGVDSVAFSTDGCQIVSGSKDRSVRIWGAKTGAKLKELRGHTNWVTSVAFSPDGNRIASGSWDESVRVWDAKTGEQLSELQGHIDAVSSVAFSTDGCRIVSGSRDKSVRVWDAKMGEQLRELQGHTEWVTSVTFSTDGCQIVSGSHDKSVRVWDAKMVEKLKELQGHNDDVNSVAFSTDGCQIVSGSRDRSVRVWDAKTGEQLSELQGHVYSVSSVAFSTDGNRIVSGSWDQLRVWNTKTGEQLRVLQGHTDVVHSVAFSMDGNKIVSGSQDTSVRVWDAKTGEQLRVLEGHTSTVTSVTFSRDEDHIVSGSGDSVLVWDAKTGEPRQLQRHNHGVSSVAFSPDGTRIVCSSWHPSVWVWDAKTGELLKELQGHTHWVTSVAFSPDSNRIASGSHDTSLRVWDAKTGEQLRELRGHANIVRSVAFSPDSNKIVSGSDDRLVRVWADLNVDASWAMGEDGWILSGVDRLVWVPSTIRTVLLRPHNSLIISRNGSATISFTQCKLGTFWHECYLS